MSVCGQTEEESASDETGASIAGGGGGGVGAGGGRGAPLRDMYETKAVSKVVRVLTVLAYLLSVSLAAILLSVYYVCVWRAPEPPPLNETEPVAARRTHPHAHTHAHAHPHAHAYHVQDLRAPYSFTGGSNISVSGEVPTPDNVTSPAEGDPPAYPPAPSSPDPPATLEGGYTTDVIGTPPGATNETDDVT